MKLGRRLCSRPGGAYGGGVDGNKELIEVRALAELRVLVDELAVVCKLGKGVGANVRHVVAGAHGRVIIEDGVDEVVELPEHLARLLDLGGGGDAGKVGGGGKRAGRRLVGGAERWEEREKEVRRNRHGGGDGNGGERHRRRQKKRWGE